MTRTRSVLFRRLSAAGGSTSLRGYAPQHHVSERCHHLCVHPTSLVTPGRHVFPRKPSHLPWGHRYTELPQRWLPPTAARGPPLTPARDPHRTSSIHLRTE